jgi:hypothetical protein
MSRLPPSRIRPVAARAFAAITLAALAAAPRADTGAGPQRREDPLSVVRAYMKAWSALPERRGVRPQDIQAVADDAATHFAPDGIYIDSTVGTPLHGVASAKEQVILPFLTAFPNARWEMTDKPLVHGETIEFHWRFSGNNWGPFVLDPACAGKGEVLRLEGHSKIRVEHGLVVYQEDTYDPAAIPVQLSQAAAACAAAKPSAAPAAR